MEQTELIYLIEDAEQGGDLQTIENGKAARVELDNMNKQLAALREAGEKTAQALGKVLYKIAYSSAGHPFTISEIESFRDAFKAWEAAKK